MTCTAPSQAMEPSPLFLQLEQRLASGEDPHTVMCAAYGYMARGLSDDESETLRAIADRITGTVPRAVPAKAFPDATAGTRLDVTARYKAVRNTLNKVLSPPRKKQRSPDRQASRERCRSLCDGSLPEPLRRLLSQAQYAALVIVAMNTNSSGVCCLPLDAIAAMAGCSRSSVKSALKVAEDKGFLKRTKRWVARCKNLPSLIRIISQEWLDWLKRRFDRRRRDRGQSAGAAKNSATTKNTDISNRGAIASGEAVFGIRKGASRYSEPKTTARSSP